MDDEQLTGFQRHCLQQLERRLGQSGVPFVSETGGQNETFIIVRFGVGSKNFRVYVYCDEAGYFVDEDWNIYEQEDFDSDDELIRVLLAALEREIESA